MTAPWEWMVGVVSRGRGRIVGVASVGLVSELGAGDQKPGPPGCAASLGSPASEAMTQAPSFQPGHELPQGSLKGPPEILRHPPKAL